MRGITLKIKKLKYLFDGYLVCFEINFTGNREIDKGVRNEPDKHIIEDTIKKRQIKKD